MNRRELIEGLILLLFGGLKKPPATVVAPPAAKAEYVGWDLGGQDVVAIARYRSGERRFYVWRGPDVEPLRWTVQSP